MSHSTGHVNHNITVTSVQIAAKDVADAIGDTIPYALVGGAACLLLGGGRLTQDIDLVVPQGSTTASRRLLREHSAFTVEPRTLHTKHTSTGVDIEILSPPALFQGSFDATTPTVTVGGVRVLHPLRILDAKCRSVLGRSTDFKRATDAEDIIFLLRYCVNNGIEVKADEMVNAIPEVIEYIIDQSWVPREAWRAAGYVDGEGWSQ